MHKILPVALLFLSAPAYATDVFCVNTKDADKIIELVVENGQVKGATYSNQDYGNFDDRPLQPSEYTYDGSTVEFQGDIYGCR